MGLFNLILKTMNLQSDGLFHKTWYFQCYCGKPHIFYRMCKPIELSCPDCGWLGNESQTNHLTDEETIDLISIFGNGFKSKHETWHGNICPKCSNPDLILI